ncbi:hypothetical protein J6590_037825 [Homalodisca vitripennis]|nr:hypothetical protein J6590_037825 [Homalodisca vitripennis]
MVAYNVHDAQMGRTLELILRSNPSALNELLLPLHRNLRVLIHILEILTAVNSDIDFSCPSGARNILKFSSNAGLSTEDLNSKQEGVTICVDGRNFNWGVFMTNPIETQSAPMGNPLAFPDPAGVNWRCVQWYHSAAITEAAWIKVVLCTGNLITELLLHHRQLRRFKSRRSRPARRVLLQQPPRCGPTGSPRFPTGANGSTGDRGFRYWDDHMRVPPPPPRTSPKHEPVFTL